MTQFRIIDQAQWTTSRNPGFVDRIERILHTAAPMTEQYSAMRLPRRVTVRLMTPTGLRAATRLHIHLTGRAVAARYDSRAEQHAAYWAVHDALAGFVQVHKKAWFLIQGRVLQDEDGDFLAFMPAMHLGARSSDRSLTLTAGHELVHIAQRQRLPGLDEFFYGQVAEHQLGWRAEEDVIPLPLAAEGHAMWVHRQIVTRLGGVGDEFPGDPRPEAWMRRRARPYREFQLATRQSLYHHGQPFMNALAADGGPERVASVFDHVSRLPTHAELADPQLWLQRHPHPVAAAFS